MEEKMYVIATRGKNNKELYLKCKEDNNYDKKIMFEWCEDIEESYADFDYIRIEKLAQSYFKNYNKWYIKEHNYEFN